MNKTKDKHPCIHNGHRKRLRSTIHKVGLENLSDVQILEFILTLCIPRGDTNEIAHKLLNKFGNISNVLDADIFELQKVSGVGENAANILTIIPQIAQFYFKDKNKTTLNFNSLKEVANYSKNLYIGTENESAYLILLKKDKCTLIETYKLCDGDYSKVEISLLEITKLLTSRNSENVIIIHNHPNHSATPSHSDYDAYNKLNVFLKQLGVFLVDSIIIGKNNYFSFKNNVLINFD